MGSTRVRGGRIGHIYIIRRRIGHIWVINRGDKSEGKAEGEGARGDHNSAR
ncbi:hypothetical protein [Vulcanisaeta distributa]|uniref:hypothetical protein n=1 Tax=Vulcanisaeta distributa TaxID=164451 RepID=UPI001FB1D09C|nr:hypothetical protein [Vulcanisaeta distributa]